MNDEPQMLDYDSDDEYWAAYAAWANKQSDEIIIIPIAGRTITSATAWADGSGISIVLDGGTIMQIAARESLRGELYWELEEAP